ncbi:hypothetical protein JMN32_19305 [Fulvivirga sp. 29W222]|uniref:Uncharacterized protein n=1 Tax=Fulvivirga marina TaxID=2494733 RepID=A0A937FYQ9_9BACT|nr:hypothetical protein [Fulvivirga marina]MBL6448469.1 hypothetical protein [Fulvivirga marina]
MKEVLPISAAECSVDVIEKITQQVNHMATQIEGIDIGDFIPVVVGKDVYGVEYSGNSSGDEYKECTDTRCYDDTRIIHEVCRRNDWPIGAPILICSMETGTCCFCKCH